jgi:ribosomal protein S18 acetylase RimI-like enzyme
MHQEQNRDLLLTDLELVRRAQAIVGDYKASRLQIIADRPGNPMGAEIRRFEDAVACRAPPFGEHLFNRAVGFTDEQLDVALEVVSWYQEAEVPGAFEIAPGPSSDRLLELLHSLGFRHTGFHARFAGRPSGREESPPGVEVLRLANTEHIEAFSAAYHRGWAATGPPVPVEPWLGAPGWSLYLGLCDGNPAGAAVLYLCGGDAYLADCAVDPKYRRRGVHKALLDRRCDDAAAAGADVVFSGADFLSASHRNMSRKGLTLLFTTAIWTSRS